MASPKPAFFILPPAHLKKRLHENSASPGMPADAPGKAAAYRRNMPGVRTAREQAENRLRRLLQTRGPAPAVYIRAPLFTASLPGEPPPEAASPVHFACMAAAVFSTVHSFFNRGRWG